MKPISKKMTYIRYAKDQIDYLRVLSTRHNTPVSAILRWAHESHEGPILDRRLPEDGIYCLGRSLHVPKYGVSAWQSRLIVEAFLCRMTLLSIDEQKEVFKYRRLQDMQQRSGKS